MDVGTGLTIGFSILGAVAVIFRIFPPKKKNGNPGNNPNGKYLLEKVFDEYKEGTIVRIQGLEGDVSEIKDGVKRLHKRIDEALK